MFLERLVNFYVVAIELVDRLAILVDVRCFPGTDVADSCSMRSGNYVRMQHFVRRSTYVRFRRFWGDVLREFMQRLFAALHGILGQTTWRQTNVVVNRAKVP
jgi:hypothetical protein